MSDKKQTRPLPEVEALAPDPSSLKGLTMALGIEPAKPGHDPLLGCDIGGVMIVRLIAEGGMGRVYEGKQEKPGRTVAVKVMRPGLTSPSVLKRFEYEAEVLGRLQHPGIAHIYSVGVHRMGNASVPYFIMEYIADATTLTKYAADLKLPTRQRLDLFRSVCEAVAHGHQKGVIHRDLKPSNILVDASGQPKVIDFGVARATDSDMALTTMQTDVGQLIGTLQYMSPEQFRADPNDIDVRSDVYALGVILYELLAGKMPYDVKKKAIHEVARIVQEDDPTPLSSFNRALKGDVAVIAGKCLEKDKGRRYSSASELGSDVGRYLTGEPISASPPGFVDGLVRLAKKHRAAAAAAAGVFSALVIAVIGVGIFATRADEARRRAESAQRIDEESRADAETRRIQAQQARAESVAAEKRATQQQEIATKRLYEANLHRISQCIKEHEFGIARSLFRETAAIWGPQSLPIELKYLDAQIEGMGILVGKGSLSPIVRQVLSPDGIRLATASADGTACLWDTDSGKQLVVFQGRGGSIRHLVFSSDSTRLVTVSTDKIARLWNVAGDADKVPLEVDVGAIWSLSLNSDGSRLITDSADGTKKVWDVATAKQLAVLENPNGDQVKSSPDRKGVWFARADSATLSPDGKVVAARWNEKHVQIWDATTGNRLALLEGHNESIQQLRFSPDSTRLATGAFDNTARLWEVPTGKQMALLQHDSYVWGLAFSPDGSRLATGSSDKSGKDKAHIWDTTTGKQVRVLDGHGDSVISLAFSPDGTRLFTGCGNRDEHWRLWEVSSGKQLAVFDGHGRSVVASACSDKGGRVATLTEEKTVRLWEVPSGKNLRVLEGHDAKVLGGGVTNIRFTPDGTRLVTGSGDKTARLWDAITGKQLAVLRNNDRTDGLRLSSDGSKLATVSGKNVRLWDLATAKQIALLEGPSRYAGAISFSPDGSKLASGSHDKTVRLWDVATGRQLAVFEGHDGLIGFGPDGTRLVTYGANTLRILEVASGKELAVLKVPAFAQLAFSRDGTRVATGSELGPVVIWDAHTGERLVELRGHGRGFYNVPAFSPDGKRLATCSSDRTARLWDVATGKQLAVLEGHGAEISRLAFSPDGTRLATASADKTARLWDIPTGKQLAVCEGHSDAVTAIAFAPDGTRLVTGSADSTARLWGVSHGELLRAHLEAEAIERRLEERVTVWLKDGPDAAVGKLREEKPTLTPDEYRVASNMILSRSAGGSRAADHK